MNYSVLNSEFTTHKSQLINSKCAKRTILALASGKAERKTQNSKLKISFMPDNPTTKRSSKAAPKAFDKNYGHLQPQAIDIEKVVLGALMIDKDAFSIVSETLRPETFYEPRHQKIYNAIQTLSMNENPVDIMTVVDEL